MESKHWGGALVVATVLFAGNKLSLAQEKEPLALPALGGAPVLGDGVVGLAPNLTPHGEYAPQALAPGGANVEGGVSLQSLIDLAMANNPAIQALAATTQKAAGFRDQVSLLPNPRVGYEGRGVGDSINDEHTIFAEQEFVTAKKLSMNRTIQNEALRAQLQELDAQRLRVSTDVVILYYQLLSQQKQLALVTEFHSIMQSGYTVAEQRLKAAEGSRIDLLQTQVQRDEIDLRKTQIGSRINALWRSLSAVSGGVRLDPAPLIDDFPSYESNVQWEEVGRAIVCASPEYLAAQARIQQARAELRRHGVQAIPNITVQLGATVDSSSNYRTLDLEVGAPLPIFNRNQGNIAAARGEYSRAVMDSQRIEHAIMARLATVSQEYQNSMEAVELLRDKILPAAREALELAISAYQAGELSFIQLLETRRSYFETNLNSVVSQAQLAISQAKVNGLMLTGALDPIRDDSGGDSFRDRTLGAR